MPAPTAYDDDSSSSSDSDDEFLTMTHGAPGAAGGAADREAIVRKKLLESFYGAAVGAAVGSGGGGDGGADGHGHGHGHHGDEGGGAAADGPGAASSAATSVAIADADKSDLDSPHFNPALHTSRHIRKSNVRSLLETDETLALDIRSLDSTMQTLVYENYSKFIDATDAVRSIGRSVDTYEAGLTRLADGIVKIESITKSVDDALRTSRSEVAEKLRLRRLLTRLDALLRLPTTLRTHIESGHTRLAARSHLNATAILGQHSAGFESLKSIEVECNAILKTMIQDLRRKLVHWSGAARVGGSLFGTARARQLLSKGEAGTDGEEDTKDGMEVDDEDEEEEEEDLDDYRLNSGPDDPKSVAEIFECAGTLVMFSSAAITGNSAIDEEDGDAHMAEDYDEHKQNDSSVPSEFDSGLSVSECKKFALDACTRHLERILDAHHIELSERAIDDKVQSSTSISAAAAAAVAVAPSLGEQQEDAEAVPNGHYLIPTGCLDGMLETASLFGLTFGKTAQETSTTARGSYTDQSSTVDQQLLSDFVTEAFATFIGHVRAVLLEKSVEGERERRVAAIERASALSQDAAYQDLEDEDDGEAYAEIAGALGRLLQAVREVASGLALPEVGLNVEAASALVDQAIEMTENMVRRRVSRRFKSLQVRVVRECIIPFAKDAIAVDDTADTNEDSESKTDAGDEEEKEEIDGEEEKHGDEEDDTSVVEAIRVVQMVQRASIALSDGMQLFDDAARAILTGGVTDGPSSPVDTAMIKSAVEKNAKRFAIWLAAVLEIVAGCDASEPKRLLDLKPAKKVHADDEAPAPAPVLIDSAVLTEDSDFAAGFDDEDEGDKAMDLLYDLIADLDEEASESARFDLTLAICEMCRLAERSVCENMSQSIASSVAEENKAVIKNNSFFGEGPAPSSRTNSKTDIDADDSIKRRFLAAASRILQLYSMDRGSQAADAACVGLFMIADTNSNGLPTAPTNAAVRILEIAKIASIECANIFGGDRMASPIVPFPDADTDAIGMTHLKARQTSSGASMKGLQLDVERMFIEAVQVFPHSMHMMEFTRNAVVATILKVAFKAMIEQARVCSFTTFGYRQLQVDCAFLRHMVLHYVEDDVMADGTNGCKSLYNLLSDFLLNVGERCSDRECVGVEEYYDEQRGGLLTPLSIAGNVMENNEEERERFVIVDSKAG